MTSTPMPDADAVRERVRRHYAAAATATRPAEAETGCCGTAEQVGFGADLYGEDERVELPQAAVTASLGCGNPTAVAVMRPGDTVLDLGSGGGIDLLLSAKRVGPAGKVYGLDMTEEMLALARRNIAEAGATNVEVLKGVMEAIPLSAASVDTVISNCVVNLSPDKPAVFSEVFRVLKPGGRVGISDVVAEDRLSASDRAERGGYTDCIAGALAEHEYSEVMAAAGFSDITLTRTHEVADGMHSAIVQAAKPGPGRLEVTIAPLRETDWPLVRAIYEQGIQTGNATFEREAPDWPAWDSAHLDEPRLVAHAPDGEVVGWAALAPVSERCVYDGVADVSIYIAGSARGRGVGRKLLAALIDRADRAGIWTLQAGVFPENAASLALHHACGFRTVGVRERIGKMDGHWRDVVLLERRSPSID